MKKIVFLLLLAPAVVFGQTTEKKAVKWYNITEAMELAKKEPRPLIIDMFTDWCGWCKRMDAVTFSDTAVAAYLNAHFYPVKFNAETDDEIKFRDTVWTNVNKKNGTGRTHSLAENLLQGHMSYPTIVYLVPSTGLIAPVAGYMGPQDIEPILLYFGEGIYAVNNVFEAYTKGIKAPRLFKTANKE